MKLSQALAAELCPESPWEHSLEGGHVRAFFLGATCFTIGAAFFALQLSSDLCFWLGCGFWIPGSSLYMYAPVKELLAIPSACTFEKICNEWCIIMCMVCFIVGCSLAFVPPSDAILELINALFLAGALFNMVPALYQVICRRGEVSPRAWPSLWRPPIFLVEMLSASLFLAAAVLEDYVSEDTIQTGISLWFPGSVIGFYVPYELVRQRHQKLEEGDDRELQASMRESTSSSSSSLSLSSSSDLAGSRIC